jgi:hypothetical protein
MFEMSCQEFEDFIYITVLQERAKLTKCPGAGTSLSSTVHQFPNRYDRSQIAVPCFEKAEYIVTIGGHNINDFPHFPPITGKTDGWTHCKDIE